MANFPELERVIEVVKKLRDPKDGCPWDLKQDHQSLLAYLIEESYEFIDAVESKDFSQMKDELGDVLLQVLLHSTIAEQDGKFNLEDTAKNLADKMIRRHPHVFGDAGKLPVSEIKSNWEKIKKEEKKDKHTLIDPSVIRLPAMQAAYKIGKKTQKIGFDWSDAKEVYAKVAEEFKEFEEEYLAKEIEREKMEEELGDFFFTAAQLARHLDIDPEECLRRANRKFLRRFHKMEEFSKNDKNDLADMDKEQLEALWNKVKKDEA